MIETRKFGCYREQTNVYISQIHHMGILLFIMTLRCQVILLCYITYVLTHWKICHVRK